MGRIVAGHLDGEGEAVGIARLGQQFLGLLHIVGIGVSQRSIEILLKAGVHGGTHLGAVTVRGQFHHGIRIHGIAHGLTHLLIVEGSDGIVQVDGLHQIHGALQHIVAVGQGVDLIAGQVGHQIQAAGVQRGHHGGVVLKDLVGHLVQLGLLAVVIGVLLQHYILLHAAGDVLEGAGADGLGRLLGIVLGHDVDVGHITDEVAVGSGQGKADLVALSLGVHNSRKRLCHSRVHCGSGAGFKGIEHVVHSALSTIVEHHTVTKGEGVGQLVIRNRMLGSDSIDEVTVRVGLHKALKDVKHDLSSSCGRHLIRVKTIIQVLGNTHGDLVCMILLTTDRVLPGRSARFVAGFGSLIRCPSACAE